ncbi:MAG: ATP-binding protein, partial [Pseudomonadota bacterium]
IGGIVSITASANSVMPLESVFIGGVGGFLGAAGITWLERLKIDDSVGAIPAHLFAGIWGTLAVALFSDLEKIGTGLTRIEQFWIQGLGIAAAGLFTFGISYSVLFIINRIYPLRVSRRAEEIGLNIAEHGAGSALQNLLAEMEDHRASGDFTGRVRVEEGSDVAIIAQQYNQVLERIRRESGRRENVIKELEQARYEAEQAARSKSRFLAHMSHELRTPLNAIIGFASLMRMHPAKSVEEQARYLEYAGDIETSGRHLLRVINDILDFSRLEEDQVALKEELVLAADLIAYVNRMFKPLAEEKEISLIADSNNLSISISADEKLMRQTLINLLSNAIKFTPISGTIEIKGGVEADGRLAISVADSGPGIPPEKVEKAMRSFGQVDDGFTKVEQQGTGLGLPLARAFMRLHQGTLTVSNGPNGGAEITIRLPAKRVDPADPAIGALAY